MPKRTAGRAPHDPDALGLTAVLVPEPTIVLGRWAATSGARPFIRCEARREGQRRLKFDGLNACNSGNMADRELQQLRADIATLRRILDTALDERDRVKVKACADVLHERLERLKVLEEASTLSGHRERSLP